MKGRARWTTVRTHARPGELLLVLAGPGPERRPAALPAGRGRVCPRSRRQVGCRPSWCEERRPWHAAMSSSTPRASPCAAGSTRRTASGTAAPTVVMAHGFSAVKEMYLDDYAEVFAAAGLNALVFDNRNFGASDGEPRQEIDPWAQVRDYRHAITYASTLAGGRRVADRDLGQQLLRRPRAGGRPPSTAGSRRVVSQVPLVSGHDNLRALVRADFIAGFREQFDADRAGPLPGRAAGDGAGRRRGPARAVGAADRRTPGSGSPRPARTRAPSWRNEVHAAQRRDVHRVRAGRLPAVHQPDAAADAARRSATTSRRPSSRSRRSTGRTSRRSCRSCPAGTSTPTSRVRRISQAAARDWFVEHLAP